MINATSVINTNTRHNGFSLVEILVVVVIISIGLLALAKFQGTNLKETTDAKQRTKAVSIAEQEIESMRNFMNDADFRAKLVSTNAQELPRDAGDSTTYTRTRTVTERKDGSKEVQVTINWTDQFGGTGSTTVSSVIASKNPALAPAAISLSTSTVATTSATTVGTSATTTTGSAATTANPDTVLVDTITCQCSGSTASPSGHSSGMGFFGNNATLTNACNTCCSTTGGGGGMGGMSGGGMGSTTSTCSVYQSGRMMGM